MLPLLAARCSKHLSYVRLHLCLGAYEACGYSDCIALESFLDGAALLRTLLIDVRMVLQEEAHQRHRVY